MGKDVVRFLYLLCSLVNESWESCHCSCCADCATSVPCSAICSHPPFPGGIPASGACSSPLLGWSRAAIPPWQSRRRRVDVPAGKMGFAEGSALAVEQLQSPALQEMGVAAPQ